jgi:hypothetical protein
MAELDAAERAAREAQRDAGRGVLAALDRVRIGRWIARRHGTATAIGKLDAGELLRRIGRGLSVTRAPCGDRDIDCSARSIRCDCSALGTK